MAAGTVPLVGYVRVSSVAGRTDERFQSPELQREVMERWALLRYGQRGHKWLSWFTDLDRSGVSIDRPALNDARDLAIANRAAIVVFDIARYSRSVPEGLTALERLAADDVRVISASEDLDATTPEGELSLTMFLAMSQYQVRRIGASWRNVIHRNKRDGWWHGVVPYGYRRPTAKEVAAIGRRAGVIVPDEKAADHVRELFRRYLEGESLYALGKRGVDNGWFSRDGTAKDILTNAAYAGMVTMAETTVQRYARGPRKGEIRRDNHGRPLRDRLPGTEKHYRGRHEPIVSARDFIRARRRMTAEARPAYEHHPTARWSAAGITKCGGCGRALSFHDKTAVAEDGRYLICGNRRCTSKVGSVRVSDLEEVLASAVAELASGLKTEARRRAGRELQRSRKNRGDDRDALLARKTKLNAAIAKAAASRLLADVDDALSVEEIDAALGVLRAELRQIEGRLTPIDELGQARRQELEAMIDRADDLASLWPEMTNDERVEALRALGAVVVIAPAPARRAPVAGRVRLRVPWLPDEQAV
jgi:site-specific DNA recombinase